MAESGWLRHMLTVGVFEFRRSIRDIWQDKARFAFMVLGVLIPSLLFAVAMVFFADAIRGVEALPIPAQLRGTIALFWMFALFFVAQRVTSVRTRIKAESAMLTTVSARTVAGGLVPAETLRILAYIGIPALVVTGVGVFLFNSPASLVLVPLAALLFASTLVVIGSAFGYAAAWLVVTVRFVARHKTILGGIISLVWMGGFFLVLFPQIGIVSEESLAWLPIGWFLDLALLGTGLLDAPLRAVGVGISSLVLLIGGGFLVERVTVALWFTEPVSVETGDTVRESVTGESSQQSYRDALAAAISPLAVPHIVSTPVRRVAEWALLRTRRDPNRLMFVLIPVFIVISQLVGAGIQSGSIRTLLAPVSAVMLSWLAGSLFAMNPLGDEGSVLPVTLTAVSGKQYVRGLMVPGLVLGLPVVFIVTAITGIISPYTLFEQVGLIVLGAYLTCVAVTITPAIGMALPRFSAFSVGQSRDVIPPRMMAVAVHIALVTLPGAFLTALLLIPKTTRAILAGLVGALPAFLFGLLAGSKSGFLASIAEWFTALGEGIQATGIHQVQIVAGGLLLLGGTLVSVYLYRNAITRFERYSPS